MTSLRPDAVYPSERSGAFAGGEAPLGVGLLLRGQGGFAAEAGAALARCPASCVAPLDDAPALVLRHGAQEGQRQRALEHFVENDLEEGSRRRSSDTRRADARPAEISAKRSSEAIWRKTQS
jgi:hypothetical protein